MKSIKMKSIKKTVKGITSKIKKVKESIKMPKKDKSTDKCGC